MLGSSLPPAVSGGDRLLMEGTLEVVALGRLTKSELNWSWFRQKGRKGVPGGWNSVSKCLEALSSLEGVCTVSWG